MRTKNSGATKSIVLALLALLGPFLSGCSGSLNDGSPTRAANSNNSNKNLVWVTFSGEIIDGPVTQSDIIVRTQSDVIVWTGSSSNQAGYAATISVSPSDYPLTLQSNGGIDLVSGVSPEFVLRSAVVGTDVTIGNINTFSTIIHTVAGAQTGRLNSSGIQSATEVVMQNLNFGLDRTLVSDPIAAPVQDNNIASLIRSSEAFAEMIRRTRTALSAANLSISANDIVAILGADLADGFIDGLGNGADARVAATATVVSVQVLVEAMSNELRVGGFDVANRINAAIAQIRPNANVLTGDLTVPGATITQAGIAAAAAYAFSPIEELGALLDSLYEMSAGVSAQIVKDTVPAGAVATLDDVISRVATSSSSELHRVNNSVRNSMGPADVDPFPPIINLLGPTAVSTKIDEQYIELGATAVDNRDGDISSLIVIDNSSVNTTVTDAYFVTYNVSDSGSNSAEEVVRAVSVFDPDTPDTVPPVIRLIGASELELNEGDTYLEPGAFAADNVDGDVSSQIVIDNSSVNTNVPGSYFVTYSVSDAAGNATSPLTRSVNVLELPLEFGGEPWEGILTEMVGYAAYSDVTGGAGRRLITVTNLNDTGSGSLRQAVSDAANGGAWIRFSAGLSGTIKLSMPINMVRDVTIDGRGANITIEGPGGSRSTIDAGRGDQNWILMYVKLNGPIGNNNDLLNVQNSGSDNPTTSDLVERFWLFHVDLRRSEDELFSVRRSRGNYTIQSCLFDQPTGTGYGMLMYNSDSLGQWDNIQQKSTWTGNYWFSIRERGPRISVPANVHLFGNYWDDWDGSLVRVVSRNGALIAQALFENNIADATGASNLLARADESGLQFGEIRASGNLLLNGATIIERNRTSVFTPPYPYTAATATIALRDKIVANAGWQYIPFPD